MGIDQYLRKGLKIKGVVIFCDWIKNKKMLIGFNEKKIIHHYLFYKLPFLSLGELNLHFFRPFMASQTHAHTFSLFLEL